jgi:hypothetical protein
MLAQVNAAAKAGDGELLLKLAAELKAELKKKGWLKGEK